MADAIQTIIADLQKEKRSPDARAEPIIVPNMDMQAAFQEIETFMQSVTGGVTSFNTRTGAVTLLAADVSGVGGLLGGAPAQVSTLQIGAGSVVSTLTTFAQWTPTDQSGAGLTITKNDARFAVIGNIVLATYDLTYPTTANSATALLSLPVAQNAAFGGAFAVQTQAAISAAFNALIWPNTGGPFIAFKFSVAATNVSNANLSGERILGSLIYST